MLKKNPERYVFKKLDYNEILDCLQEIYAILASGRGSEFKLLVTVSPIPYLATFDPSCGAIANNCYSKSVQRAAVEAFIAYHDNVGYFPSYEIVTQSDNKIVWEEDLRYIKSEFLEYLMAYALSALLSDELLAEHPEISVKSVDMKVLNMFSDLGLDGFFRTYFKAAEEVEDARVALIKARENVRTARDKARNVVAEANEMVQLSRAEVEALLNERERLVEEKNQLYVEKSKLEMERTKIPVSGRLEPTISKTGR